MTEAAATKTAMRRTVVILLGWLAAAYVAGIPAGEASIANAEPRAGKVPLVVNTGPECFAGKTHAPSPGKARD